MTLYFTPHFFYKDVYSQLFSNLFQSIHYHEKPQYGTQVYLRSWGKNCFPWSRYCELGSYLLEKWSTGLDRKWWDFLSLKKLSIPRNFVIWNKSVFSCILRTLWSMSLKPEPSQASSKNLSTAHLKVLSPPLPAGTEPFSCQSLSFSSFVPIPNQLLIDSNFSFSCIPLITTSL